MLDGNYTTRKDATRKCALAARRRGHGVFAVMADGQCASGPNTEENFVKFGYGNYDECSTMAAGNAVYIIWKRRSGNVDGKTNSFLVSLISNVLLRLLL